MMTEQQQDLLTEFQAYLQQSRLEQSQMPEQVDLATLLAEMAGLKTEVKTESRQFKNTLDVLSDTLNTLNTHQQSLAAELARQEAHQQQIRAETARIFLLELIDLYDRLSHSLEVLQNYRPVDALFRHSQTQDVRFIQSVTTGQSMTISRLEQCLQRYQVQIRECAGKRLDPTRMIAVETGHEPQQENGVVLQELRKGFLYQDQVLRLAEVKVNKTR